MFHVNLDLIYFKKRILGMFFINFFSNRLNLFKKTAKKLQQM
jgi:hypothetical protein